VLLSSKTLDWSRHATVVLSTCRCELCRTHNRRLDNSTLCSEQQLSGTSLALLSIFNPKSAYALQSFDKSIGIVTVSNPDLVKITCDALKFQLIRFEGEYEEDGKILLSATELVATQRDGLVIFYEEGEQAYALVTEGNALMLQKLDSGPRDLLKLTCRREKNEEADIDPDPWVPVFGMHTESDPCAWTRNQPAVRRWMAVRTSRREGIPLSQVAWLFRWRSRE